MKMVLYDLFIVQVVVKVIDMLFCDDLYFQLILLCQLGDDGVYVVIGCECVIVFIGCDLLLEVDWLVVVYWVCIGDIVVCDVVGFFVFEWYYELYIFVKLWIQCKIGCIGDSVMCEYGENWIWLDEEWYCVQIVQWWFDMLQVLLVVECDVLIDCVIVVDEEIQVWFDGYLYDEYVYIVLVFGVDIVEYCVIYDDWWCEILLWLIGCQFGVFVLLLGEIVEQEVVV